ncbi:putative G-protein coupled receptor 33 [Rhinophrynus dorsalis]
MSGYSTSGIHTNSTDERTKAAIPINNVLSTTIFLITFLFGLVVNNLYLWVLGFRMRKSVNTTWFFYLILSNLVFTLTMPFVAVYLLTEPRWILGSFLCKLINSMLSLSMYAAVFLLIVISLDRYMLVFHPHWYRGHMNPCRASAICYLLWGFAFLCSCPYFALRQTRISHDNKTTICYNDYSFLGKLDNQNKIKVKWFLFFFRLVLGFLLPFFIITLCYLRIALKLKKENMARSNKPYKIIFIAIASFFMSWIPYHVWYGMSMEKDSFHQSTMDALRNFSTCLSCFNHCFTPVLYLFIIQNFKKEFKKSIMSIIESVLNEAFNSGNRSIEEK